MRRSATTSGSGLRMGEGLAERISQDGARGRVEQRSPGVPDPTRTRRLLHPGTHVIMWSATLMTSALCSMTATVLP